MAESLKNVREWVKIVTGLLSIPVAVSSAIKLAQGDSGYWIILLIILGAFLWSSLFWVYFGRVKTDQVLYDLAGNKRPAVKTSVQSPLIRKLALVAIFTIPILAVSVFFGLKYLENRPPDKVVILVANFDGPESQNYRVTDTILSSLRLKLAIYKDVQVRALGRVISEVDGSTVARTEGAKYKATIVIWGWYGVTAQSVPLSVHFEILRPPKYMPELTDESRGQVQSVALSELESFTIQPRLSAQMIYLSLFVMGTTRFAMGDWDQAVTFFSDALNQTAEPVPALDQSVVYFYRGIAYFKKGDYDRAIADFSLAIQVKPDYFKAYINRGAVYSIKGDYDLAIAEYDKAIQLKPDDPVPYYNRGYTYSHMGDYACAIADYDKAIQLKPADFIGYYGRGIAYFKKGDYDRAIIDFNRAIQLQPDDSDTYTSRGTAYFEKGDYDRAIADFNRAIQLQPDDSDTYTSRGNAYFEKGDYDRAIADFKKVLELSDDTDLRQWALEKLKALGG